MVGKIIFYIFAIFTLLSGGSSLQAKIKDFKLHFYDGMPGCQCFLHCTCYSNHVSGFDDPRLHSHSLSDAQDALWHMFVDRVWNMHRHGGYTCADSRYPHCPYGTLGKMLEHFQYREAHDCCMLSDYLNNLELYSQIIEQEKEYCLFLRSKWKEEGPRFAFSDDRVMAAAKKQQGAIEDFRCNIVEDYALILSECPHFEHAENLAYIYNEGLIFMMRGDMEDSLQSIKRYIQFCKQNRRLDLLTSSVYQNKGDAYFAVGLYNKAIKSLTKAITKDPGNKNAYFSRAQAYFESGNFDRAIEDYLASEKTKSLKNVQLLTSLEFHDALLKGLSEGVRESTTDFFPSLYRSAHGLGEAMWVFVNHPIDSSKHLANTCYELTNVCIQNVKRIALFDKSKLDRLAVEIIELYEKFDRLNDAEKGSLIGKAIGKYGIDIFLTRGLGKGANGLKKLSLTRKAKDANSICNLEAMAASQANKEALTTKIAERQLQKEAIRKELKIEVDKQNKHIAGKHNFEPPRNRSIFEHPDPQGLVNKFAGKGTPEEKSIPGSPGYKEVVNFGEFIGYSVNKNTGEKIATTWGKIHYGKNGVHIVPTNPRN